MVSEGFGSLNNSPFILLQNSDLTSPWQSRLGQYALALIEGLLQLNTNDINMHAINRFESLSKRRIKSLNYDPLALKNAQCVLFY
jgi:hypothetical protein